MELLGKHITWQRPNGSGPALRELTLKCCGACLAPDRLRLALQPVERLNLHVADLEEAQFSVLPQLPHLTSLAIRSMSAPAPAIIHCSVLRELDVAYISSNPLPAHLPAGALPQLTRLIVSDRNASPAWVALPELRSLDVVTEFTTVGRR